jgi:hypothetical protein
VGKECLEVGKVVEEKTENNAVFEQTMIVDVEIGMMQIAVVIETMETENLALACTFVWSEWDWTS